MTSIYSINYHLKQHKRDPFIEFIKSMLMNPFILHTKPHLESEEDINGN